MILPLLRERAATDGLPLAIVAAEAVHVLLLDALFADPNSGIMTLQGGTCLHLIHGGYRYSEDLDLAGQDLDGSAARKIVERARPEVERLCVEVLGPAQLAWKAPSRSGRLAAHWFHITPEGTGQRLRVKLEFANFPIYLPGVLPVRSDLDLLHRRPLVHALQPPELLAEKVAAVLGRRYLKGRDLFDLWYLDTVLQAPLEQELLTRKLADYGVALNAEHVRERISVVAAADLRSEMERFLPQRHRRQLGEDGYEAVRRRAKEVLERAAETVGLP